MARCSASPTSGANSLPSSSESSASVQMNPQTFPDRLQGKVLVIDDEPDIGELICAAAEGIGLNCTATASPEVFLASLKNDIDVVIMDLRMPGTDGVELLRKLAANGCQAKVVLISGIDRKVLRSAEELTVSLGLDAAGYLQKPFRINDVEQLLRHVCSHPHSTRRKPPEEIPVTEAELRHAIEFDEFTVHYQPQIDLGSGRCVGCEALVRLMHPTRGIVYPDMFIVTAEQLNLIDSLTTLVTRRAMREYAQLASEQAYSLSINFSACSLTDLKLPEQLARQADEYDFPLSRLVMEITETGLISELGKALDILTRLRMKGVGLSIDDFGTGYSSMAQIQRIPATELKIDRIFVVQMLDDDTARAVVDKTISLGHALDMHIVAEGVESGAHGAELDRLGCDYAQGYHFGHPMLFAQLCDWLARNGE
ncbi:MAG: hypothetical protein CGU28_11720 [Candidatus Dactylopiibacterium carminicum]|nr:MAG: hypothetical protein CGU28_11720 [Candidatus Dactylopiibacterium carminicum]